jgi:hypothetical protein
MEFTSFDYVALATRNFFSRLAEGFSLGAASLSQALRKEPRDMTTFEVIESFDDSTVQPLQPATVRWLSPEELEEIFGNPMVDPSYSFLDANLFHDETA